MKLTNIIMTLLFYLGRIIYLARMLRPRRSLFIVSGFVFIVIITLLLQMDGSGKHSIVGNLCAVDFLLFLV